MGDQVISEATMDSAMKKIVDDTVGDIPDPDNGKKKGKKKHTGLKIFFAVLILLIAGAGTTYAVFANQYKEKFIEGTFINGIDASNMTVDEVEARIRQSVENYDLTITFRDDATEKLTGDDIGYSYVSDNGVAEILEKQNNYDWLRGKLGETRNYTVGEAFKYDETKLETAIEALPELQEANETAPTNAYMKEASDGTFSIVPETQGNKVVMDVAMTAIKDAVSKSEKTVDISTLDGAYETPVVLSSNQDMINQVTALNAFLSTTVTYDLPDGSKQTLDKTTLKDWISLQDNGYYYLNDTVISDNCSAYVQLLAKKVDEVHTTRTFHSTNRGDMELSCSKYGHVIDQTTETAALKDNITNHTSAEREPAWSLNKTVSDNFGGTYIEVDIVNQHVYFYIDGALYTDSDCVTGLATDSERATPTGIYAIFSKETNKTLKGPLGDDGQPTYTSFVNYWMPFHNGVGLHDASWRSEFGGTIYKYSGSHGCVNLPYSAAKAIYAEAEIGTTVIVI